MCVSAHACTHAHMDVWGGYIVEEMGLDEESAVHALTIPCYTLFVSLVTRRKEKNPICWKQGSGYNGNWIHKVQWQYLSWSWVNLKFVCGEGKEWEQPFQRHRGGKNKTCLRNGWAVLDPTWGQEWVKRERRSCCTNFPSFQFWKYLSCFPKEGVNFFILGANPGIEVAWRQEVMYHSFDFQKVKDSNWRKYDKTVRGTFNLLHKLQETSHDSLCSGTI